MLRELYTKEDVDFMLQWIKRLDLVKSVSIGWSEIQDQKSNEEEPDKVRSEKPVSLSPLGFTEVLAALLKVKPKEEKKEKSPAAKVVFWYFMTIAK